MPHVLNGNALTRFSDLLARWREEDAALSPEQVVAEHLLVGMQSKPE